MPEIPHTGFQVESAEINGLAQGLLAAVRSGTGPERVAAMGTLSLEQAYRVQQRLLELRVAEGERLVGWKAGCTSAAIQKQFGLTQPIVGRLLAPGIFANGIELEADRLVDGAVEAELVLRLKHDLAGEIDEAEAAAAIASVAPGIEFHHYRFFYGAPSSQELIASNGIHAGLAIGSETAYSAGFDLALEGVGLWVNGELKASGLNAEILGRGPLASLCWLSAQAGRRGLRLRAGEWVIPGSAVALVRVQAGDRIEARFTRLGTCRVRLV